MNIRVIITLALLLNFTVFSKGCNPGNGSPGGNDNFGLGFPFKSTKTVEFNENQMGSYLEILETIKIDKFALNIVISSLLFFFLSRHFRLRRFIVPAVITSFLFTLPFIVAIESIAYLFYYIVLIPSYLITVPFVLTFSVFGNGAYFLKISGIFASFIWFVLMTLIFRGIQIIFSKPSESSETV